MLQIQVNHKTIVLYPDTAIIMNLLSPVFNDQGNHSLDFETPREGNEPVFEYPHRIAKKSLPVKDKPFRLSHGSYAIEGLLSTLSAKGSGYRHYIKTGISALIDQLRDTQLSDLIFESIELGEINSEVFDSLNDIIEGNLEAGCNFPMIRNAGMYGEGEASLNKEYEGFMNAWYGTGLVRNIIDPGNPTNLNTIAPQPFAWRILEAIWNYIGYRHDNPLRSSASLKAITCLNIRTMDFKEKRFVVNAQINGYQEITDSGRIRFSLDSPLPLEDDDNCWSTSLFRYEIKHQGYHHIEYELTVTSENVVTPPAESTAEISISKENQDGSGQIQLDFYLHRAPAFNQTVIIRTLRFTATTADVGKYLFLEGEFVNDIADKSEVRVSGNIFIRNVSYLAWNQVARTLNLSNHMPEATCLEFLNAVSDTLGVEFFIDTERKEVRSKFLTAILNANPGERIGNVTGIEIDIEDETGFNFEFSDDFSDAYQASVEDTSTYESIGVFFKKSDLPIPTKINQVAEITLTGEIYLSVYDEENQRLAWQFADHIFKELKIGNGNIPVAPDASPVLMGTETFRAVANIPCAKINQLGFSNAFGTGEQNCKIRFMLYLGKDFIYGPMASATGIDSQGNRVSTFSLSWQGPYGLYETFWKPWVQWRMNSARRISYKIALNADKYHLLQQIRMDRPEDIDGNLCLIESIEFVMLIDKITDLVIRAWKV